MAQKLMLWSKSHPIIVLATLLLLSLFSIEHIKKVRIDTSSKGMMMADDPELDYYNETVEKFGSENIVVIYVQDRDLFTPDKLKELSRLNDTLQGLEGVYKTESLFTATNFKGSGGILDNNPLLDLVPDNQERIDQIKQDALRNPILVNNIISRDGSSVSINLYWNSAGIKNFEQLFIETLDQTLLPFTSKFDKIFQAGPPQTRIEVMRMMDKDKNILFPLAFLIIFVLIIVTTRSVNGAILPVLTSTFSLIFTFAFMGAMDIPLTVLTFIVPSLIIVIGATEDVHLMSEYHEGLHQMKGNKDKALHYMASKVGTAVTLTAVTTFIGFLCISFNRIIFLKQFGVASAFGLLVNPLVTVTLAPVYLRYFGGKKPAIANKSDLMTRFLDRIAQKNIFIVQHRKKSALAVVAALTLLVGMFSVTIKTENSAKKNLRKDSPIIVQSEILHENLAGGNSFFIRISSGVPGTFKTAEGLQQLVKIQQYLEQLGHFDKTVSVDNYVRLIHREMNNGDPAFYKIPQNHPKPAATISETTEESEDLLDPDFSDLDLIDLDSEDLDDQDNKSVTQKGSEGFSTEADSLISQYFLFLHREEIESYVSADFSEANILVRHNIGASYDLKQILRELHKTIPELLHSRFKYGITSEGILINKAADSIAVGQIQGVLILLLVIFTIMSFLFVNVKAGLICLVPNMFPVVIVFGVMGIFDIPLNMGTCMIAVIGIGIAVDDTIHLMTRYQKEVRRLQDQNKAIEACISAEIRPVFSTSISLALGFGILAISNLVPISQLGILGAVAMACALIGDLIITPILLSSTQLITLWDLTKLKIKRELINSKLFVGLKVWQIKRLLLLGQLNEVQKGDYIIREKETGQDLYVILHGDVAITKQIPGSDKKIQVATLSDGDVMGELSLLFDSPRTANAIAQNDVMYFKIGLKGLERIDKLFPKTISVVFQNISKIIGQRFIEREEKYLKEQSAKLS